MKKSLLCTLACLCIFILSCTDPNFEVSNSSSPILPANPYTYSKLELPKNSNLGFTNNVLGVFKGSNGEIKKIFIQDPNQTTIQIPDLNGNISLFQKIGEEPFNSNINNNFFKTKITDLGATLGRVLFYDKALSINNKVSCGSCHHQEKAFADGQKLSPGFGTKLTERNSMAILNPVLQNNLFWDSRARSITDLSLQPIQNHIEMGMELIDKLPNKLKDKAYYEKLFNDAFGDENITTERISDALSQFVGSITTSKSKFDIGQLNDIELKGQQLFEMHCGTCHSGGNFMADDSPGGEYGVNFGSGQDLRGATNIGLDLISKDLGLGGGNFKIPSLRNIMLTAPYMHDGRFATIDEVLDHYASGIKPSAKLDKKLKHSNGSVKFIPINNADKLLIKAFLNTLTDHELTKDPKYKDPFID